MTEKPRKKSAITFTLPSDRPAASFAFLPVELKTAIAREVKLADEAKRAERAARGRKPSRKPDALAQLSMVSRDWNAVVKPLLWEHVDLGRHSLGALYTFVQSTLSAVHSLIRSLAWSHTSIVAASGKAMHSYDYEMGGSTSSDDKLDKKEERVVKAIEKHGKLASKKDNLFRRFRAIEFLVAMVVKKCEKLTAVDYANLNEFEQFVENPSFPHWDNIAQSALVGKAPQLDSIKVSAWFDPQGSNVQPILKACRNLRKLDLEDISLGVMCAVETTSSSYKTLLRSIFSMPKLISLGLCISFLSKDLKIPVTAPLQQLTLRGVGVSDFLLFEPFITRAADGLRTLKLLAPPSDDLFDPLEKKSTKQALSSAPLPLPNLKRLVFSASFPPTLLDRFSTSSLTSVRFEDPQNLERGDRCGGDEDEDDKPGEAKSSLPSFLETHSSTLEHFELSIDEDTLDSGWADDVTKPVKKLCKEKGITYAQEARPNRDEYYAAQYDGEPECG